MDGSCCLAKSPYILQAWGAVGSDVSIHSIAVLMMLVMSFGMPWIIAFFFEFKVSHTKHNIVI